MAAAYNEDEIKRFACRLEEQTNNAQITCDMIDHDLRSICDILLKYRGKAKGGYSNLDVVRADTGDVAFDLAMSCDQFAGAFYGLRAEWGDTCIKLAGYMMGFYESTYANNVVSREEKENILNRFKELYESNPELDKASGSPGNHRGIYTKGRSIREMMENNWQNIRPRDFDDRDASQRVNVNYTGPTTKSGQNLYNSLFNKLDSGTFDPINKKEDK